MAPRAAKVAAVALIAGVAMPGVARADGATSSYSSSSYPTIQDDPEYEPSTCTLDDASPAAIARRDARLEDLDDVVLSASVGPYSAVGDDRHDATATMHHDVGFAWRAGLDVFPSSTLAFVAEARRFDAANVPEGAPSERTFFDASIGWTLHARGMAWERTYRTRHGGIVPAHCAMHRLELVPLVGLATLFAHDELRPALDDREVGPSAGVLLRVWGADAHGRDGAELRPTLFYLPASRRFGGRLAAHLIVGGFTFGPELFALGAHELRLTFDFGITLAL